MKCPTKQTLECQRVISPVSYQLSFLIHTQKLWKRKNENVHILSSGKPGPYMNSSSRCVKDRLTRFHCSTSAVRCRQFMAISRSVFQSGGGGKWCVHATSHTSISTLNTRSHSWSPTSSATNSGSVNYKNSLHVFFISHIRVPYSVSGLTRQCIVCFVKINRFICYKKLFFPSSAANWLCRFQLIGSRL